MTTYISLIFLKYAHKSFTYVAETLTPLLNLGTFSWIVTRISRKEISQYPTLVAVHQAEVRGPLVGGGPKVENCCSSTSYPGRTYSRVRHTRVGRTLEYVLPGL